MLKKIPHNSSERSCSQNYKLQNHRCKLSCFFFFLGEISQCLPLEVISYEFSVKSCFFHVDMLNRNLKMTILFIYVSCTSKFPPPPPPPHTHTHTHRARRQFPRGWGTAYTGFFPGGPVKIGVLFINNSFSVEQAISYFAVTGVSKQVLLFGLIIFHLRSAKVLSSWLTR